MSRYLVGSMRLTLVALLAVGISAAASSQDALRVVADVDTKTASVPKVADPEPADPKKPETPKRLPSILNFGLESYFGLTNLRGSTARLNDGQWAGNGNAYPSNFSLNWRRGETQAARVSVGIGDLYARSGAPFKQPVEAFYQMGAGGEDTLTVGKFYSPFAAQDWQYESRYGAMLHAARGKMDYQLALQYSEARKTPNAYLRAAVQSGESTAFGLSLASGTGLSYGSSHNMALGLDMTHSMRLGSFLGEYMFADSRGKAFQFLSAKFDFDTQTAWTPFIGGYYWHDATTELGRFSSGIAGFDFAVTQYFSAGAAFARANGRNIFWLQTKTSL